MELEVCATVRVLDISRGGAMVSGPVHVPPGEWALLRASVGGTVIALPFEISWRSGFGGSGDDQSAGRAGGAFADLDGDSRLKLEAFLSHVR